MVKKFTIPFASQGDANDIPDALQVDGKVSFTQGFGYDYERPYDDPQAKDIAREDMNGLFKAITTAVGELQTLGASEWSNAVSYPKGAIVYFEKDLYVSQVDDNQNTPPQNWVSITSIANDSLKKAANLSDLTNKTTARNNLGLGSSATLNKTDVLGTSTNLVATQKLVNDAKINLESSKQDKLTFVGYGPEVMKTGAYGLGTTKIEYVEKTAIVLPSGIFIAQDGVDSLKIPEKTAFLNFTGAGIRWLGIREGSGELVYASWGSSNYRKAYDTANTTIDKSGFLRALGSANALTTSDVTQSLGASTTSVMSQKAVTDESSKNTPIGTVQAYIGETAPNDKWLLCRGQAFSAESYPDLAQLLPDLKIPDLRGVALRGLDASRGFDPGRALLSYQEDAVQKINGELTTGSPKYDEFKISPSDVFKVVRLGVSSKFSYVAGSNTYEGIQYSFDSSLVTRTNSQDETVMKNVAVNFIIKAR